MDGTYSFAALDDTILGFQEVDVILRAEAVTELLNIAASLPVIA